MNATTTTSNRDTNGHYRHPDGSWDYERNTSWDFYTYPNRHDDRKWQEKLDSEHRWRLKEIQKELDYKATKAAEPIANALIMAGIGSGRGFGRAVADEGYDLVALTGRQLMAKPIPPREILMHENGQTLFYAQSRNQIIAWRGVGKTMFSLAMAGAFCSGGKVLDFQAGRSCRVLYLDGELPEAQLQERVGQMIPADALDNFSAINAEFVAGATKGINLLTTRGFESLLRHIDRFKPDVLFLDSRVMLFPGKQLEESHLCAIEERMQTLRLRKLCIIENHHVGKNGLQRGLSNNDDALDVQIKLDKVDGWEPGQGLQFKLQYEKVRHAAQLESGYAVALVGKTWQRVVDTNEAAIVTLHGEGKSSRAIGEELGIHQTTVVRAIKKWKAREAKRQAEPKTDVGF
jgi:hypothetical protein